MQVDRRLNRYLKEMATVRKRERRMTLMSGKVKAAKREGDQGLPGSNSVITLSQSPLPTPSMHPRQFPVIIFGGAVQ